jgi:hypothetical protein
MCIIKYVLPARTRILVVSYRVASLTCLLYIILCCVMQVGSIGVRGGVLNYYRALKQVRVVPSFPAFTACFSYRFYCV